VPVINGEYYFLSDFITTESQSATMGDRETDRLQQHRPSAGAAASRLQRPRDLVKPALVITPVSTGQTGHQPRVTSPHNHRVSNVTSD